MANLGPKKIGSNYQKLLQISQSGAVADGTGSAFALRLSGSSNVGIGTNPSPNIDLAVAGTISSSIISASTGVFSANSIYLGSEIVTQTHFTDLKLGKSLLSGSDGRELVGRKIRDPKDLDSYLKFGGDDNLTLYIGSKRMMYFDEDNSKIHYGTLGLNSISPQHNFYGNITANSHITASGNISASGTIYASKFESAGTSGETISFNDNLNITGNITASGMISASYNITVTGNNPYFLAKEHETEFLKMGVEPTTGDMQIAWDDSDDLHLGTLSMPSDTTIDSKMIIGSSGKSWISGSLNIGGSPTVASAKTLTVKGDISASGGFYGDGSNLTGINVGSWYSSATELTSSKAILVKGNISSSGTIIGDSINVGGGLLNNVQIGSTTPATYLKVDNVTINGSQLSANGTLRLNAIGSTSYINAYRKLHINEGISGSGGIDVLGNIKTISGSVIANSITANNGLLNNVQIGSTTPATYLKVDNVEINGNTIKNTIWNGPLVLDTNGPIGTIKANKKLHIPAGISGSNVIISSSGNSGNIDVYQNNNLKVRLSGVNGSVSMSGAVSASRAYFNTLPTQASSVAVGGLYTLSGSQLPFATGSVGSTVRALWNTYSGSKFVLIK
tara:strand:+ start:553 stop:2409 length:1857 start_codon:yes stop_codon:yes gene_type:complete